MCMSQLYREIHNKVDLVLKSLLSYPFSTTIDFKNAFPPLRILHHISSPTPS